VVSFFLSSIFLSFFRVYSQRPQIGCLPYFHTWCGPSVNLECRSEMCCTRLAGNTGRKKSPFWHHHTILSNYIFGTKACIDNRKKNLLNTNTSSTCPDNMANFGLLTAEICWRVWGTPANFNGFRVLASLLHGTLEWASAKLCGVEQRASPIFGKAAITLGIGPHFQLFLVSSLFFLFGSVRQIKLAILQLLTHVNVVHRIVSYIFYAIDRDNTEVSGERPIRQADYVHCVSFP